jgi:hypothetical protein
MTGPERPSQSQSIRCPKHGYFYRPDQARGCPKCLEGPVAGEPVRAESDVAKPGRRFSPVTVLIGLVVVSGIGWGGYKAIQKLGDKGEELYVEMQEIEGRINPDLVRAQLVALEGLVYADEVEPYSHGSSIQRAAVVLYSAVMRRSPRLLATRYGSKIVGFGNFASRSEDVGYSTINMESVRREWESVRSAVFHDADWFRSAGR